MIEGGVKIHVDMDRFSRQFQNAQTALDRMIMTDMEPYMPRQTGTLINNTKARSESMAGTGTVCAASPPYGRFLYEGKVMVDPITKSPWARKGAKKVVIGKNLTYSNPKATPHWFDTAKKTYAASWVRDTKRIAGGG